MTRALFRIAGKTASHLVQATLGAILAICFLAFLEFVLLGGLS